MKDRIDLRVNAGDWIQTNKKLMRLKDKVALVTGAGSGIGKAIAERFAEEGARVVVNYHSGGKHNGADVADAITKTGGTAVAIAAEVYERTDVNRMVQQTVERFGRLDVAVCNAGIEIQKPFLDVTDEEW